MARPAMFPAAPPDHTGRRRYAASGSTRPAFHNGSAAIAEQVVRAYNKKQSLGLSEAEVADLAQYLRFL